MWSVLLQNDKIRTNILLISVIYIMTLKSLVTYILILSLIQKNVNLKIAKPGKERERILMELKEWYFMVMAFTIVLLTEYYKWDIEIFPQQLYHSISNCKIKIESLDYSKLVKIIWNRRYSNLYFSVDRARVSKIWLVLRGDKFRIFFL